MTTPSQLSLDYSPSPRRPRARTRDPETSHEAAHSITQAAINKQHEIILLILRQYGPATDREIRAHYVRLRAAMGWDHYSEQSMRSRRAELDVNHRKQPLVEWTGAHRTHGTTRRWRVWRAV